MMIKNHVVFILLLMTSVFEARAQSEYVHGIWSGFVKMKQVYEGEMGHSTLEIIVNVTDNRSIGTMKYEGEVKIGNEVHKVTCNGGGISRLYRLEMAKDYDTADIYTYYIHAIGPAYTCSPADGALQGEDSRRDISFGDQVSESNKNTLAGTQTHKVDNGAGIVTTTFTWDLRQDPVDVELIVTPEDYDTWLPEPGKNEFTVGSVMNISLKLQAKGGGPTDKKVKKFELHLSGTSNEPGITINFPNVPGDKPDLRFMIQTNAEIDTGFQSLKINCAGGCQSAIAKIGSYDGGGWTTLKVEAILEDDETRIQGKLLTSTGESDILIPKRKKDSKIGEAWLKKYNSPEEMDDIEESDGNSNNGDGFSAYEEYRGVIAEGKFKRLDPQKKELGIFATQRDFALFSEGMNLLKNASDIEIVRFDIDRREVAPDGQINFNKKSAHVYDQFAILLFDAGLGGKALGEMYSKSNDPDIPANTIAVVIDWTFIQRVHQRRIAETRPDLLKFTVKEYLAQTVAHELGHAMNIWHHGNDIRFDSYSISEERYVPFDVNTLSDAIRIFDRNGALITTRPISLLNVGGKLGTVESGSLSCLLNYYPYYYWGYTVGADGARIYNQVPLLPLGTIFCRSNKGTGINTTQLYFGDAAGGKGNCLGQIKLKK